MRANQQQIANKVQQFQQYLSAIYIKNTIQQSHNTLHSTLQHHSSTHV